MKESLKRRQDGLWYDLELQWLGLFRFKGFDGVTVHLEDMDPL